MNNFDNLWLYDLIPKLVEEFLPETYLEIGVNEGKSLMCAIKPPSSIRRLILSDDWNKTYGGTGRLTHSHIESLLKGVFHGEVVWLDGNSKVTVPTLEKNTIDMALVDGDHSAEGCRRDMESVLPLLKSGGIMIVDDLIHPAHPWLAEVFDQFVKDFRLKPLALHGTGVVQK